jgi:hypothetical protein
MIEKATFKAKITLKENSLILSKLGEHCKPAFKASHRERVALFSFPEIRRAVILGFGRKQK